MPALSPVRLINFYLMTRLIRYGMNKAYTLCKQFGGMKIKSGGSIHCNSDLRGIRRMVLGHKSILYKKQSIYLSGKGRFSMGDRSHVAPYGYFLIEDQSLSIGEDVAIGPFCSFFCSSNSHTPGKLFRENYEKGDILIGNNVFIGAQSVILPGTIIENNVVVAANSVVRGKLEAGYLYAGSPCKPIKKIR